MRAIEQSSVRERVMADRVTEFLADAGYTTIRVEPADIWLRYWFSVVLNQPADDLLTLGVVMADGCPRVMDANAMIRMLREGKSCLY